MHLRKPQHHRCLIHLSGHDIDHTADQFSAARFQNQRRHQIARQNRRLKIRSPLKAVRSVGVQPMPPRTLAHGQRIPPRRLDQNIPRLLGDHRVVPAHHSGKRDRLLRISHNQIFRSKRALHAIERLQLLTIFSFSNDELSALKQIHVKHVRRLADLPQHVVCGVNGVADRALIEQRQAMCNLRGRRFDSSSVNNPSRESRAKLRLLDLYRKRRIVRRFC